MNSEDYLNSLLSLPNMWGPQTSRDGRWVAWTWFQTGPAADIYAAPMDGSRDPIRLSRTDEDTFLVSWTPDSRGVIVEQDEGGNERAQLFRIDLARPGVLIPLTEPNPNYFLRGGDFHPNNHWLVYGANFDVYTGEEIEPTWIYRHDLETGERIPLARPQKGGYLRPRLNASGSHVLYTRKDRHPAGRQVWLVDIEGHEDREILNFGASVKTNAFWFPDGERVLVLSETGTHTRLGVWSLADGQTRWVIDDPDRNIERAYVPFGSDKIAMVEVREARIASSLMDLDTGEEYPIPSETGNLIPLAPAGSEAWIGLTYHARQPVDLVRFKPQNLSGSSAVSISKVWDRTPLTPKDFTPAEDFRWQAQDGLPIQGWLYRSQGEVKGTVVYVHGGPTSHSEDKINPQIQFLTHQGFHVLDPNYRGSTGFDLSFREAIKEDGWGGREQEDIRAGIEALIAAGIAEPGKVGITGTSYGGYSAWCAITRFPTEVVSAAAPICGMTDLVVDYETTRPDLRPLSEEMMGGRPDQVPEHYDQRSPIHSVGNIRGRLLIVQGAQDPNVTPENVRAVRSELERADVPYEELSYADEGHGISKPSNKHTLYLQLADFFSRSFADK